MSVFLAACAGTTTEVTRAPAITGPSNDSQPLPVEGELLDLDEIERLTEVAISDSLLLARHEREKLIPKQSDASTLVAIDSRLAWLAGDMETWASLLNTLAKDNSEAVDFVLQERIKRAALAEEWIPAAQLLFEYISRKPRTGHRAALSDRLFAYLLRADQTALQAERARTSNAAWQKWLDMQIAYRHGSRDFEVWRDGGNFLPEQPVAPRHLAKVSGLPAIQSIALLLPLSSGLAGASEAVIGGAMSQLYRLFPDPNRRPAIVAIDSDQYDDAASAYQGAIDRGAEMVIGPLTKTDVTSLSRLPNRAIPIIALNQIEGLSSHNPQQWLSFSLAPEDEARQIADIAFGQSCREAIAVGMDNPRGRRLFDAFKARWGEHGGRLQGALLVDDPADTNQAMGNLLGSGSSDNRIQAIESAFDLPLDARGRGRNDFGCIFMLAPDPDVARTWRPLLIFHMTGDIPVFATSAINDGLKDPRNRDLNGVLFLEAPAMLPPGNSDRLGRLRALGRDALTLAQHWEQIETTEQWVLRGKTGFLRRRPDGSIERALELATFDGAEVQPLRLR
ncbi:MAG: penicillin-binding protein activator [Pseudomonadota bacterium]|nr:penicillin-binding protein activator [Pseudomonadota bacterium]